MARTTVTIGRGPTQRTFESKQALMAFCKEVLGMYRNGETINEEHSQFLRDLLERHPEAARKIGQGVKRLYRALSDQGTPCFHLERVDGKTTDFSYKSCVYGKAKTLEQEFAEACGQAVREDLKEAKKAHFAKFGDERGLVACDISGEKIAWDEAHLDHKKPLTLEVIVKTFIAANGLKITPEMLSTAHDMQYVTTFVDKELAQRFRAYHNGLAQLRMIKKGLNLSLGGSERITKAKRPVLLKGKRGNIEPNLCLFEPPESEQAD